MHIVKIVVLGGAGVGKSAIIEQFTTNSFQEEYCTTVRPVVQTRTVMLNSAAGYNRVYQLKIVDLPPLSSFPQNSLEEWSGGVSLRTASAYLLVYDASNLDTFHQLKVLKEQIYDSRDMNKVPILVVANKFDILSTTNVQNLLSSSSQESRERRDICSMVRKQWKLTHVECSAKYNWRIINLFKEITRLCDILEMTHAKDNTHMSHMDGLHHNKCAIS